MHNMNLEKLNKFLLDLDNKYDINSGACALIAYMLSSWCVKNNISYKTINLSHFLNGAQ